MNIEKIKEAMESAHRIPCTCVAPGTKESMGFGIGSVLIMRRSMIVVCSADGENVYPKPGLKHRAVTRSSAVAFGFRPKSRIVHKGHLIYVCASARLRDEVSLARIINRVAKKYGKS